MANSQGEDDGTKANEQVLTIIWVRDKLGQWLWEWRGGFGFQHPSIESLLPRHCVLCWVYTDRHRSLAWRKSLTKGQSLPHLAEPAKSWSTWNLQTFVICVVYSIMSHIQRILLCLHKFRGYLRPELVETHRATIVCSLWFREWRNAQNLL